MTHEEVNKALYDKMNAEMTKFRDWLLTQPAEEILKNAYEYAEKEEIMLAMEYNDLDDERAQAMLGLENPLECAYKAHENMLTESVPYLLEVIEQFADGLIEQERKRELRETPLYPFPASYAREHGELDQYRASRRVNIACRDAIDAAIQRHYKDFTLNAAAVREVAQDFSYERMLYVLANTVRQQDWDKRYSEDNRSWAATVPVHENPDGMGGDRNRDFVLQSHSVKVDAFIKAARQEYQQAQEAMAQTTKIESRKPGRNRKKTPAR